MTIPKNQSEEPKSVDVRQLQELKLIDLPQLEELIKKAELPDALHQEYLRKRWLHQIRWWDKRAWEARRYYFRLRAAIVLGGVLVPFLTTANFSDEVDPWLRRVAAAVSLLVAACAALEALYSWGTIWLEKRRAAELLKVEGWLFLYGGGRYRGQERREAFLDFVTEVESKIAAEVGEYVAVAQSAQGKPLPRPAPGSTAGPSTP